MRGGCCRSRVIFKESYICSTYITYICWEFGRRPNSKKLYMLGIYNWKSCYICWAKKLYKLYMIKKELYMFKSAAGENFENSSSLKIVIYVFRAVIYVEN